MSSVVNRRRRPRRSVGSVRWSLTGRAGWYRAAGPCPAPASFAGGRGGVAACCFCVAAGRRLHRDGGTDRASWRLTVPGSDADRIFREAGDGGPARPELRTAEADVAVQIGAARANVPTRAPPPYLVHDALMPHQARLERCADEPASSATWPLIAPRTSSVLTTRGLTTRPSDWPAARFGWPGSGNGRRSRSRAAHASRLYAAGRGPAALGAAGTHLHYSAVNGVTAAQFRRTGWVPGSLRDGPFEARTAALDYLLRGPRLGRTSTAAAPRGGEIPDQ